MSVYRVPRMKKRKYGPIEHSDQASNKPAWVGPGTVIALDGANLWVSMLGEFWRVAREQCRPATTDEKAGIEAVLQDCEELIEQYKRSPHKAGYKDLTQEEWPPEDEEPHKDTRESAPNGPCREVRFNDQAWDEEYTPSIQDEEAVVEEEGEGAAERHERRRSVVEPEQEEDPETVSRETTSVPPNPHFPVVPETPPLTPAQFARANPQLQDQIQESWTRAPRLDGHPGASAGPAGPQWRHEAGRPGPYFTTGHWYLDLGEDPTAREEEEAQNRNTKIKELLQKGEAAKDYWVVDLEAETIHRVHGRKRKALFNPRFPSDLPVPFECMGDERSIQKVKKNSKMKEEVIDRWKERPSEKFQKEEWWTGQTTFKLIKGDILDSDLAEKKGQDEVDLKKESPQDLEEWKLSDLAEWNKVAGSGAVHVLPLDESRRVRKELAEEGKENRILPTKIARRYKPAEQPGEPPMKKSRLCIRGDQDPDIMELERFSPTLNTTNFNLLLQLAANEHMVATVGDLKNAFCQSQPLQRANGPLYFQLPKEGIQGLHPEQIVQIINGCYGLVDAPLHWRQSLMADLEKLGYVVSALHPCIMRLFNSDGTKLLGAIAIEVDDLFTVGHEEHHDKMTQLQKMYTFGKYVKLQEEARGAAFNGRRIKQLPSGEF